jgi:hypothetical protein
MALWQLDIPKIDGPLAVFFHDALARGGPPLWEDRLGLGFPLYAEGQIGSFYPPNWLIYQLEPLTALDVSRVLHLTFAGVGTGLLALRLSGSRTGSLVAVAVAVLGGAIVTKLEWTNLVAAYAWLPWILLPLVRRPAPTRPGLVVAGVLWGIQALAGHPNTWLLTGLAAAVLLLATTRDRGALGRVVVFGLVGGAVGSIQLLPTLILTTLSARNTGLSADDVFTSASTVFDPLAFGFARPFIRISDGTWDIFTQWYPDGIFALLEASAFVGLIVLGLAAIGARVPRHRPWLFVIGVLLAIPLLAALRPLAWLEVPILNGLRSPVRAYLVVAFVLGLLAAVGIGRIGRTDSEPARRRAVRVASVVVAWYVGTLFVARWVPDLFDLAMRASSSRFDAADAAVLREKAIAALTEAVPALVEIILAAIAALLLWRATTAAPPGDRGSGPRARLPGPTLPAPATRLLLGSLAIAPLVLFTFQANRVAPAAMAWPKDSELATALRAVGPNRVLTLDPPGFYDGAPDRLAAAGIRDIDMFSSLDLRATDDLVAALRGDGPDVPLLRQVVGIDTLVTFGVPCPGRDSQQLVTDQAVVCRVDRLTAPFWLPAAAVSPGPGPEPGGLTAPIKPRDTTLDLAAVVASAVPASAVLTDEPGWLEVEVDAPADGYLWVDRAWWPSWSVTVDREPVTPARALAGQLIPVTAGTHLVELRIVPWEVLIGAIAAVVVTAAASIWAIWPSRRRRPAEVGAERTSAG